MSEAYMQWKRWISNRIVNARLDAGVSQSELAERSRISLSYIERLERAEHSPSYLARMKIAKALDKPADYFEVMP